MSRKQQSKSSQSSRRTKPRSGSTRKDVRRRSVGLAEIKDDLSRYLRMAERGEILITRHGKPAGVLIGFSSEEDWIEYRLENHPDFLQRIARARADLDAGMGTRLEDMDKGPRAG